jgi:poly(A) polymerase
VLLAWTRAPQSATDPAWRDLAALPARWTAPPFPLKSADLMARGVVRGPALGEAMRAAEQAWIAAGFPQDQAALDRIADDAARGGVL